MNLMSIAPDRVSTPAKLFLLAMILNGFGNGIFNVIGQLYLTSFGFESEALGTIFMMNSVGAALLTVPAGILADRYGKRKMIIFSFCSAGFAFMLFLTAKDIETFSLAFLLLGVSNAASVVLTPIYSSFFDKGDMDRAFGLLGFLNIISVSVGSLFGFVPPILVARYGYSFQAAYWTMLAISMGFFPPVMPLLIMSARDAVESKRREVFRFNLRSKRMVAKFSLIAMISSVGGGVFFSLFPYYVNKKFGVESDALGILFFISNLVSAGANAFASRFSKRLGTLKTIAYTIGLSTPFYLIIPLAPSFTWLSTIYIMRLGIVNISSPLIGSLFMRLLYDEEKATAHSIRTMAVMGGSIASPKLGGQLMKQASLDFPAYVGSGLCAVQAASYYFLLRNEKDVT